VYQGYDSLVVADIPGIIEGAHEGEGMGLDFLKHIERNKVLIFLLDASGYADIIPIEALKVLRAELKSYKSSLLRKKSLVVANKVDLLETDDDGNITDRRDLDELKEFCNREDLPYLEISAINGLNLKEFNAQLFELYYGQ
jgi:GTP-binding protein